MRTLTRRLATAAMLAILATALDVARADDASSALPAFPGAEGFGSQTPGGRGGKVYEVTNLKDEGPGSLRAAVEAAEPRTVVFRVSGTIALTKDLEIKQPFITIAGQTAPGDGICLKNYKLGIATHDVVVRYLRVRRGHDSKLQDDGIGVYDADNVIVDHCSVSWTTDEVLNTWHHAKNTTIQWCIASEALSDAVKPGHAFAATLGGENTTYHHNLLANCAGRNPSIGGNNNSYKTINMDWRNNVVFNWEHRTMDGKPWSINIVDNYYKPGPASQLVNRIARIDMIRNDPQGHWYVAGNIIEGQEAINSDNRKGVEADAPLKVEDWLMDKPFEVAPVKMTPVKELLPVVLKDVGATLPARDKVDKRIVEEARTGKPTFAKGIIQTPADVGGWPELKSTPAPADADHDGIPDWWEAKYGLNPRDTADGSKDLNGDGYTNLEKYLNGLDPTKKIDWRKAENNRNTLTATSLLEPKSAEPAAGPQSLIPLQDIKKYIDAFNSMEEEKVVNLIPNAQFLEWMQGNVPLFACPDKGLEEMYYYRWWAYRKHIKQLDYICLTEFLPWKNPVSSAVGHHILEGRWIHEKLYLDQDLKYWMIGTDGKPHDIRNFSSWTIWSAYQRYLVNHDKAFVVGMLDDFIRYYQGWEQDKLGAEGLFWQFESRDAMEDSINGDRQAKGRRPSINSYMYGNALAIAAIAELAGKREVAETYHGKAAALKKLVQELLWDPQAQFFKVRWENGTLSDAREAVGYIPWYFMLPDRGYEKAWAQLTDPQGFWAPVGLTTAERRHPAFRTHGSGHSCEWDGAVWPFATSQSLTPLANVLNDYPQTHVSRQDYLKALQMYAAYQHLNGKPYVGEYLDEKTGQWLRNDLERGRHYNHSTFCDLVISGLVGLRPRDDEKVVVNPLVPADTWDWFCLDNILYHGRALTILWDRTGEKFGKGAGLTVLADGHAIAHAAELGSVSGELK